MILTSVISLKAHAEAAKGPVTCRGAWSSVRPCWRYKNDSAREEVFRVNLHPMMNLRFASAETLKIIDILNRYQGT